MSLSVLAVLVVVVFCFTIGACVAVFIAAPEGANTGSLVVILIGTLPPTVASLVALAKVTGIGGDVAEVKADTTRLTNGLADAKMRAALAEVVPNHMIDPAYAQEQLGVDRLTVDLHNKVVHETR